jgi:hypothetical protein
MRIRGREGLEAVRSTEHGARGLGYCQWLRATCPAPRAEKEQPA